ncbi:Spindle and kinetochore-associated protein 1, partial [Tauraco erythrolophus]
SSDLEGLCTHINMKISAIKKTLQLRNIGQEPSFRSMLCNIGNEMYLLHDLLNKMEEEVQQQEKLKNLLKELQKSAERDLDEARHLSENIPTYLPKPTACCTTKRTEKPEEEPKVVESERAKKTTKKPIPVKKVPLITIEEFQSVPTYMKGRLTYNQVNAVVTDINKAVVGKYKILHQPLKSMNAAVRNLYHRFLKDETKDTKGEFFVVEADIEEFANLKMDKRFHTILNILRHCQRLREVRGSNLVRYVIC